jgi:tRNA A-37 threonylcarbamoyl transferase component Bud32
MDKVSESGAREILKQHEAHDISWTVWREGNILLKEFRIHRWRNFFLNRRWRREHLALRRLNRYRVPSPQTYGHKMPRGGVLRYSREFLPGRPIDGLDQPRVLALSDYFRSIHGVGVTNGDASLENLLFADSGDLMLIDYGRARVSLLRSPLFYFNVGKDLARVRRRLFPVDVQQWRVFFTAYMQSTPCPAWALRLRQWSLSYWLHRWGIEPEPLLPGS